MREVKITECIINKRSVYLKIYFSLNQSHFKHRLMMMMMMMMMIYLFILDARDRRITVK